MNVIAVLRIPFILQGFRRESRCEYEKNVFLIMVIILDVNADCEGKHAFFNENLKFETAFGVTKSLKLPLSVQTRAM